MGLVSRYIAAGRSQATIGHLLLMDEAGLVAGEGRTGPRQWHAVAPRSRPRPHTNTQAHVRLPRICIVFYLLMSEKTWNEYLEKCCQYCHNIDSFLMGSCACNCSLFIGTLHKRNPNDFLSEIRRYDVDKPYDA